MHDNKGNCNDIEKWGMQPMHIFHQFNLKLFEIWLLLNESHAPENFLNVIITVPA